MVKINKKKIILLGLILLLIVVLLKTFDSSVRRNSSQKIQTSNQDNSSKDVAISLIHDGVSRQYNLHIPPGSRENKRLPLVIVFHSGGSNIEEVRRTLGWDRTADIKEFIVAYPEGTGQDFLGKHLGIWNAGKCCNPATKNKIDDSGFIKRMISDIKKDFPIDERKIYTTGISNGSMMAITVACENSDQIAALGTVAGPGQFNECSLKKPVPFIYFQGTADSCAPINGGVTEGCYDIFFKELLGFKIHGDKINFKSAQDFITDWKSLNKTSTQSQTIYQNNSAICTSSGFQTDSEVVFCKITGMGHTWPGQLDYGSSCDKGPDNPACKAAMKVLGSLYKDLNANEVIWNFFSKHSLGK